MRKGFAELGVVVTMAMVLAAAGVSGAIYAGGSLATSGILTGGAVLTAYSQMPHVKRDFRLKKAIGMCVKESRTNCDSINAWSDEDILNYIKDDMVWGNGGDMARGEIR